MARSAHLVAAPCLFFALAALSACSSVEPLACEDTPYFHVGAEGLPICGPAESAEVETWELEDWPAASPETVTVTSADDDLLYFGGLRASAEGCSADVDTFHFALASDLPRFVNAQVHLVRPLGDQSATLQLTTEVPQDSVVCASGALTPSTTLLLFMGTTATVSVAHLEPAFGGVACPTGGGGSGYRLELELRGEATVNALGRVDAMNTSARSEGTPSQLALYSVESESGAALVVRTWDPDEPTTSIGSPRFLAVDSADGTVSYVDEDVWLAQTDTLRYFEVQDCWPHVVEVTLSPG